MAERTFTIAGVSTLSGNRKLRVANGTVEARSKILERGGHTDITLVTLPHAMTKDDAIAHLRGQNMDVPDRKVRARKVAAVTSKKAKAA